MAKKIPVQYLTGAEVISLMKQRQGGKQQNEFCLEVGVSPQHLSDIYKGYRNPGPPVLKFLGVEKKVVYRLIGGKS